MVADRIIIPITIIIVGGILGWYLIVPLMLYMLDTIAFLIAKILTTLFPRNVNMPNSPEQSTIQRKCRVYSPNPLNYILNRVPITPEEVARYFNNCGKNPYPKDTFDVPFNPVVKKANRSLFKRTHPNHIISRVKR